MFKKLKRLFRALLDNEYFSTEENALACIKEIRSFIESLPKLRHQSTSDKRYGNDYASYKANRNTTWYLLFNVSRKKIYCLQSYQPSYKRLPYIYRQYHHRFETHYHYRILS